MDRPGVGWTWNEFDHLRAGGIRDIDNRPAEMPQMAHIEIPTSVRLHDGHLEARTIVEVAIANHTDILANTATRNRIGENATRQRRQQEERQSENGFGHCHVLDRIRETVPSSNPLNQPCRDALRPQRSYGCFAYRLAPEGSLAVDRGIRAGPLRKQSCGFGKAGYPLSVGIFPISFFAAPAVQRLICSPLRLFRQWRFLRADGGGAPPDDAGQHARAIVGLNQTWGKHLPPPGTSTFARWSPFGSGGTLRCSFATGSRC